MIHETEPVQTYTAACTRLSDELGGLGGQASPARVNIQGFENELPVVGASGICIEAGVGCHHNCAVVRVERVIQNPNSGEVSLTVSPKLG